MKIGSSRHPGSTTKATQPSDQYSCKCFQKKKAIYHQMLGTDGCLARVIDSSPSLLTSSFVITWVRILMVAGAYFKGNDNQDVNCIYKNPLYMESLSHSFKMLCLSLLLFLSFSAITFTSPMPATSTSQKVTKSMIHYLMLSWEYWQHMSGECRLIMLRHFSW